MTYCQITLIGNAGRDPELRFTSSGRAVCDFSLAVNRTWTDRQSNERQQETTWFKITCWGNLAENVAQYVNKGKQVLVVADRIEASAFTGRDGNLRASLDITARDVRFLAGTGGGGSGGYSSNEPDYPGGYGDYDAPSDVDDIPF